jgi:iron(III) transport system permease protein
LRHDLDRALALAIAWGIFLVCSVWPVVWMLAGSAGTRPAQAIGAALAAGRHRDLIAQTLLLGCGAAFCAASAGAPLGIALGRCDPRRVRLVRFALVVPLVLPSYVLALAWTVLTDAFAAWTFSLPAAIVVLGFSFFPIVMLATEAAVRAVPSRLAEAGWLVAQPQQVWLRILLPLISPSLAASMLLVFVLAISDFAVPSMLRVRVYTTEVFTAFAAMYDFRLATIMALPLAGIAAVASLAALEISRRPLVGRADRGQTGVPWSGRFQNIASALLAIAALGAAITPIAAVAIEARLGRVPFDDAASIDAIANGVLWSMVSATVVVGVGALLGYWRTKAGAAAAYLAEVLWLALFAVPATIAGIGIISLWNRPGISGQVYSTHAGVIIAYVSRFLPIAALLSAAFLRRVPVAAEEAAIIGGASWRRTIARVILPLSRNGLAAVWLIMFILMFGDVALAILVAPPGESNLAVRAYTLMANSPVGDVARIALVQITLSVLPLVVLAVVMRRVDGP